VRFRRRRDRVVLLIEAYQLLRARHDPRLGRSRTRDRDERAGLHPAAVEALAQRRTGGIVTHDGHEVAAGAHGGHVLRDVRCPAQREPAVTNPHHWHRRFR